MIDQEEDIVGDHNVFIVLLPLLRNKRWW